MCYIVIPIKMVLNFFAQKNFFLKISDNNVMNKIKFLVYKYDRDFQFYSYYPSVVVLMFLSFFFIIIIIIISTCVVENQIFTWGGFNAIYGDRFWVLVMPTFEKRKKEF